jgi:UDPglucose 6-dehydrogenase
LSEAVVEINNGIPGRIAGMISDHCPPPAKVALLGISYKPCTHIIEESQSIMLAKSLFTAGYQVALHDPSALDVSRDLLGKNVVCCADPYECVADASAIALLTDWPEFRTLDWKRIAMLAAPGSLVLDSWRVARSADTSAFVYRPVGVGVLAEETVS